MKSGIVSKSDAHIVTVWSIDQPFTRVCGLMPQNMFEFEIKNGSLSGNQINKTENVASIETCQILCGIEMSDCQAVSYHHVSKECYFFAKNFTTIPNSAENMNITSVLLKKKGK